MAAATRTGFLLLIALGAGAPGSPALAQGAPVPAGIDRPLDWRLDTGKAKPPGRKSAGKPAGKPAVADDAAERAARLAERRRKFFDARPDDQGPEKVPEFGGYDASKMGTETVHPGATFKF